MEWGFTLLRREPKVGQRRLASRQRGARVFAGVKDERAAFRARTGMTGPSLVYCTQSQ